MTKIEIGDWIFHTVGEHWYEVYTLHGDHFSARRVNEANVVLAETHRFDNRALGAFRRAGETHICSRCGAKYTLGWEGGSGPWRHVCESAPDKIDHPAHYGGKENPYEAIKVIQAWLGKKGAGYFCYGNAIKYMSRAGKKEGESMAKDLAKARWYLNWVEENVPDLLEEK